MKVLLISCLKINRKRLQQIALSGDAPNMTELFGSSTLPLGILSIEGFVKKHCPNVATEVISLDVQFMNRIRKSGDMKREIWQIADHFTDFLMEDIRESIEREKSDIIGLSALFDIQLPVLSVLIAEIHKLLPEVLIIAGGHPVTNMAGMVLKQNPRLDAICAGEGEIPFVELINAPDKRAFLSRSRQFITKQKTNEGVVPEYRFVENLDDIPSIYESAFFEKYGADVFCNNNNTLDVSFAKQGVLMTSRGCPYRCVFCASHAIHGRRMRAHSLERVKREIDLLHKKYFIENIVIVDDHFLFDAERAIEIVDEIGKKHMSVRFINGLAIAPITRAFVACLVRNSVKEVWLALESGSARVLRDIVHKPLTLDVAKRVLDYFKGTDIFVTVFLVIGLPGETISDIDESLAFLRTADFHWGIISSAIPVSGSGLYDILINSGEEYDVEKANFFAGHFVAKEVADHFNGDLKYTVNLDINFVHNPYMRMEEYAKAAQRFEALIALYPDHAFAHYYLEKCLERLGTAEGEHMRVFQDIVSHSAYWRKYADYFNLEEGLKSER